MAEAGSQPQLPPVEGMTHRTIEVHGLGVHVAEAGAGPPVLLVHGWPQHWYAWRKVAPPLAADRRVICADLRGFGWSDAPPGEYAKATLAADLLALLDAMELERVDMIAHDWGAWIGFILCLGHPERFEHYLALNMYTPWPEAPSLRAFPRLARLWYQVAIAAPLFGQALIERTGFVKRLITAGAVHDAWTDADLDAFTSVLRVPARARASVCLYRTFLLRELGAFLAGQFNDQRLTVPTLLMHGTRDLAIDHRGLGRWREHAEQMEVELREDSGHFIAEELPDVVVERARALFGGARPGAAAGPRASTRAEDQGGDP
jgi:pimeloyl-ACP methyl ester carboxylesterase